jgi:CheY-like chemotaxis protein
MLADSAAPPEFRTVLEMIHRNVLLEARLIDDLLDLARIRRGTLVLSREVVDAHELVNHVVAICADDLRGAQLRLVVDLAAAHHHISADPIRFQQVLWNLVKNAIKFTPPGGRVTVASRNQAQDASGPPTSGLKIEISDTGIGIEADALPRIFEMAERGGISAATRRFGGLGLGLMLSRSIVEQHDGRLSVASAGAGRGATFTLEMPLVCAPAALPSAAPLARDGHAAGPSRSRFVRILLVDDNADTLKYLAKVLRLAGHDVRTAPDMATSLRLASEADFDLVISDIELPDGSGLELMETIRTRRSVPGIALSGFGSPEDVEQSRSAGFALHLIKPFDFRRLEVAIGQVVTTTHRESVARADD